MDNDHAILFILIVSILLGMCVPDFSFREFFLRLYYKLRSNHGQK